MCCIGVGSELNVGSARKCATLLIISLVPSSAILISCMTFDLPEGGRAWLQEWLDIWVARLSYYGSHTPYQPL